MQDVTQKKAKELMDLGIALAVEEVKKSSKKKEPSGTGLQAGELEKLQQEAQKLEINFYGKSFEELEDEIELIKSIKLGEEND